MRLNKMTDYALSVMGFLLSHKGALQSAQSVSAHLGVGVASVSKVLKVLEKGGLVRSVRGAAGGYAVCLGVQEQSVLKVIELFEGPWGVMECEGASGCKIFAACHSKGSMLQVLSHVKNIFGQLPIKALEKEYTVLIPAVSVQVKKKIVVKEEIS